MTMTLKEAINVFEVNRTLLGFEYKGKMGGIDPIGYDKERECWEYDVFYDEEGESVYSLKNVLSTPFIDGKTLPEVFEEIEITDC